MIGTGVRSAVVGWYRRRASSSPVRRAARAVAAGVERLESVPGRHWYDLETNGEAALLGALGRIGGVRVVVDVGANDGDWYAAARRVLPEARILLVEIAPPLWPLLERRIAGDDRAALVRHGLGAQDGQVRLFYYPDRTSLTTTVAFPHQDRATTMQVEVRSVASFLTAQSLERIDFLKVDVEGAELPIVEGVAPLMDRGALGLIQFEYGEANVLTRTYLRDFALLGERTGYALGRVRPNGIEFAPYRLADEDFRPRNMVLCRPDLRDALVAVGGGHVTAP